MDYPFDQYQRYKNVEEIINKLRKDGTSFHILEVGANEHRNLEVFLPNDKITYLDIQLPDHLLEDPQYILGDATAMDFDDNTFDVIVAMDVFEHIFPEQRQNFIWELQRVSREFFVITAPFHSEKVRNAEKRLNTLYRSLYNEGYIWLEEHYINGLPVLEELTEFLEEQNINHSILSHGNVDIWERMMSIHFFAVWDSRMNEYRKLIDRFYNENLYNIDYAADSYRKIIIGYTNVNYSDYVIDKDEQIIDVEILNKLQFLEHQFHQLLAVVRGSEKRNTDCLQVYIDDGKGFSEETSLKRNISIYEDQNQEIELQFELAAYSTIKHVRIDPSHSKGAFRISNIVITNKQNEKVEFSLFVNNGYQTLEDVFLFLENDPYIILKLEHNFSSPVDKLTFSVQRMKKLDMLMALIQSSAETEQKQKQKYSMLEVENQSLQTEKVNLMNLNTDFSHKVEKLEENNNAYKAEIKNLTDEKNNINNSNLILQNELNQTINSRSFKLARFIQKFKFKNN
ncbi:methyltransferase domain-containing protein [Paenibacillus sp. WLX2291]|uniref:methyltransferase domain-containing protein n=1 Tax=Paenibacillus sp. WLX2291 TaxID=3296934 RepID=UPI00398404C7